MYRVDIKDSVTKVTPTGIYTRWFETAAQASRVLSTNSGLWLWSTRERELTLIGSEISRADVEARLCVPPDLFPDEVLVKALNDLELKKEANCWSRERARIEAEQQHQREVDAKLLAAQQEKERAKAIAKMVTGGMTPEEAAAEYDEEIPF